VPGPQYVTAGERVGNRPNGLMLHGCVIGAWGRRGGRVTIKAAAAAMRLG
jgi:hypothetical protein